MLYHLYLILLREGINHTTTIKNRVLYSVENKKYHLKRNGIL